MPDEAENRTHRLATLRDRLSPEMDRRTFLRTVANAGYGLGIASLLGVEDFLNVGSGEVPVVTALVREDPDDPWSIRERTRSVPAEWYARVSKAFELHNHLAEMSVTGYLGSAVQPGTYDRGTASISIQASASEIGRIEELLQVLIDGVSFDIEAIEDLGELEGETFEGEPRLAADIDDGVPGGVRCQTETGYATLGPALYHPDEQQTFFTTAEHAYYDTDPVGKPLSLPLANGETVELGTVSYAHPVEDVVTVEPVGELRPASAIDGAATQVLGQFTRAGLADLAARGEHLEKMGAETGHSSGEISGIDAVTCFTSDVCRTGQLRWGEERDLTDGDSGSVTYHRDPENPNDGVLIAGYNNARTWWPGQNYVWGVSAYHLTNEYGYHF
ncbi:hypothetical protein OB955_06825 [Halobacteria archaeon AArc-m2/3/4]|uniref:Uncharacterized protein n=1 Tax=Natronoglomus mannanivorans TaxID=2979990 RepID=A0ABT2QC13_9EURY|nr:hypothetical protein [Halobacteria archaeon AArc-m2/3/4]